MSCGWEGNHRPGITLAMHRRLKWFIHLQAQWPSKGDEHYTARCLISFIFLWLPCIADVDIIFLSCFFLSSFFPRLSSVVGF